MKNAIRVKVKNLQLRNVTIFFSLASIVVQTRWAPGNALKRLLQGVSSGVHIFSDSELKELRHGKIESPTATQTNEMTASSHENPKILPYLAICRSINQPDEE